MPVRLDADFESSDLTLLESDFRHKLNDMLRLASKSNMILKVGTTVRGPRRQAWMWCRSRSPEEITIMQETLAKSAPTMASLLSLEGSGLGPRMTEHLPGESWHQWGEAADLYVVVNGRAIWEGGWAMKLVAELASKVGLYHSYTAKFDSGYRKWHAQLRRQETPLHIRDFCESWQFAEEEMHRRFIL